MAHARETIREFLGHATTDVFFVPYASVIESFDDYAAKAIESLEAIGMTVRSLHRCGDPAAAVERARAIVVGGGNTFHLLRRLNDDKLIPVMRARIAAGVPYVGWSAGANIACPSIMTTNDMPIVWMASLDGLGVIPFQINPHYVDANPPGFYGETRARRLLEFTHLYPDIYVVGLPESGMIRIENHSIQLLGCRSVKVFRGNDEPVEVQSLAFLEESATASARGVARRASAPW